MTLPTMLYLKQLYNFNVPSINVDDISKLALSIKTPKRAHSVPQRTH